MEVYGYWPPKNLFLFDGLGIEGLKFFIAGKDDKIINQLFYDFKKCEPKSNQKLTLCYETLFWNMAKNVT